MRGWLFQDHGGAGKTVGDATSRLALLWRMTLYSLYFCNIGPHALPPATFWTYSSTSENTTWKMLIIFIILNFLFWNQNVVKVFRNEK